MLRTLRVRIVLVVGCMVFLPTLAIMVVVHWQAAESAYSLQESNAHNILETISQTVNNQHESIEFYRQAITAQRKADLIKIVDISFNIIAECKDLVDRGRLTDAQAQEQAKDILRQMRWDDGAGYVWINSNVRKYPIMIMHPIIPATEGKLLDDPSYNTVLGTGENLFSAFCDECAKSPGGEGFVEYLWPKPVEAGRLVQAQQKLSFVRLYKPWNWIVGAGVYVDDIAESAKSRTKAAIKELGDMSSQLKIGKKGYMFIFSGQKEVIVHPFLNSKEAAQMINPETNRAFFDDLMLVVKNNTGYFEYRFPKPDFPRDEIFRKRAYVTYYKPLDWYICATIYVDELEQPVMEMLGRLALISTIFFLVSLLISIWLGRSLAQPLRKLALASERMARREITASEMPSGGAAEIQDLGRVLAASFKEIIDKEREIRDNEQNLRITLNSIGDGVISTDTDGRIVRMNRIAERLTGYDAQDAKGRYFLDVVKLLDLESGNPLDNPIHEAMVSGKPFRLPRQTLLVSRDGRKTIIADSCRQILDDSGHVIGIVFGFHDITEQSRVEEQLRQSQKMDSLGQLAGGIAHDFNNMLAGIIGATELLEECVKDNSKAREYLGIIAKCCRQVSSLTEKLLAFSRKGKMLSTPTDVHDAIENGIAILQRSVDKRISIIKNLSAAKSTVIGDPSQLQNVILNLGINAGHAMPAGGELSIKTENVTLNSPLVIGADLNVTAGEYIKISVQDTGIGISPEVMDKIFEPFFTTRDIGKGTGLGLAAVYGSVKEHHGAISVQSKLNEGTRFDILLPVIDTVSPCPERPTKIQLIAGQECILFADDEPVIRRTTKQMLEDMGYSVIIASDGQEALDIYQRAKDRIDLVILDMVMPKLSGADCFRKIRQINPNARVMISSGFIGDEVISELKNEGLLGFLKKPFGRLDIGKNVRDILDGYGWE